MFLISSDQFKFDKAFSKYSIKNPSMKNFQAYFTYLIRCLDENISEEDIENILREDLPGFVKALGYPYALKENIMHTFATPSSWPQLLAVLDWLISMAKYLSEVKQFHDWMRIYLNILSSKAMVMMILESRHLIQGISRVNYLKNAQRKDFLLRTEIWM